jgi:hypothetical protein
VLYDAQRALQTLISNSVFADSLVTVIQPATTLIQQIEVMMPNFGLDEIDYDREIRTYAVKEMKDSLSRFEAVLAAEMGTTALYLISAKEGWNTLSIIDQGDRLFAETVASKVPECLGDLKSATKCLAFELFTASGFHLHRANESVLRSYFDSLAGKEKVIV